MRVALGTHEGGFGVATAWLATRIEVALMSHGGRMEVALGWLAAMRDFHAWPGTTGLRILHSPFDLLPSSSQGRFAASQAVWGRYRGGMGAAR